MKNIKNRKTGFEKKNWNSWLAGTEILESRA